MIRTFIAVDIETTGLNPLTDCITEIGAVKYVDGVETEVFESLVNPGVPIPYRITEITGIHDEMVKDAPSIGTVMEAFLEFAGEECLLGHNILFDYSFLKKAATDMGNEFGRMGMDTLKIAKKLLPDLGSRSLESLCGYFSIENIHHRALADARSAAMVYERLCAMGGEAETTFALTYSIPKREPITAKQKSFLESLIRKHKVPFERETGSLSKSEASREIDKILSTYGIER